MSEATATHAEPTKRVHKGVYMLPNLLTTASLFSGFLAMIWALDGDFDGAALAILFAALMDGLDGKVARLTNTASEFGVQYDSLADLASFGIAPAFILWQWQLHAYGRLGIAAAFVFAACGALRLARFNVSTNLAAGKKFFTGLPIPAAACTVATFILFQEFIPPHLRELSPFATLALALVLGMLMVSRIRYASFKEFGLLRARPFSSFVTMVLLFGLIVSQPRLLGFLILNGYILSGLIYSFIILPRRNKELLRTFPG
ncbi:MAG: CDP-diacylglycerol--serine O-phosphatidyltransferase [Deltaproteobacteria bacterium]|jgi:CDP-diacylglycerol--serine O-phosphatidyltransferase|nr:CDP-diacylglycerol--serine O-phosphatidyltransferase [Deltaproteobacteria bacterium]